MTRPDQIVRELRLFRRRLGDPGWVRTKEADTAYHQEWRSRNREHYNDYHRRYRRLQKLRGEG